MALTAQKVALMVLMLGIMMMGVTVLALAEDAFPTGRDTSVQETYMHNAVYTPPKKSRYASFAKAVAQQDYGSPVVNQQDSLSFVAPEGLPEPFTQQLD